MFARALIVLLVVLNIGVAAWWVARSDATSAATAAPVVGVERLQLLREVPRHAAPKPPIPPSAAQPSPSPATAVATEPSSPAATAPPVPEQCYALGPFADAAASEAARKRLQPQVSRLHVRAAAAVQPRDWRVWLPPLADRAAAQAMAARISAAGFNDYFIVAAGDEANSIALGRYRSEDSARRREAALHAGGFTDVQAQALGAAPPSQAWLDVAVATPFAAAEGKALGAARVESIDCKSVP
jgi:type IV secretory pathway VirB10-like protein